MTSMAERARAMFNGVESSASRAVAHARKLSSGSLGSRAGSSGDLASVATNGDASPREDAAPTDRAASPSPPRALRRPVRWGRVPRHPRSLRAHPRRRRG